MSWSISTSGSHASVLQAIRDYTPPHSAAVPDPNNPAKPDLSLAQAEAVKSGLISFLSALSDGDKAGSFNISASGNPGGSGGLRYVSLSIGLSS